MFSVRRSLIHGKELKFKIVTTFEKEVIISFLTH